ncbi:MAG: hypothetical protein DRH04_05420, partial [Deltaproteobacteria bacterium]
MRRANILFLVVILFLCLLLPVSSQAFEVQVATSVDSEPSPAAAYDPENHQYIVVWEQVGDSGTADGWARMVND